MLVAVFTCITEEGINCLTPMCSPGNMKTLKKTPNLQSREWKS